MENLERFKADLMLFGADERRIILDALAARDAPRPFLERLAAARRRTSQRQDSDAVTDHSRRVLVGVRLPRATAARYRACAAAHGLSLYRFVCVALEREFQRLKGGEP